MTVSTNSIVSGNEADELAALGALVDAKPRTTPVRVALFGDSTADFAQDSNWDCETPSPVFGASGTVSIGSYHERTTITQLYPMAHLVAACGIGGETTTLMLAREAAGSSATRKAVADLLSKKPDVIIYRGGSINDVAAATEATAESLAATAFTNQKTLIGRLLSAGVPIIVQGIFGYGDGSAANSATPNAVRTALLSLNAQTKAYCSGFPGRLYYIDPQEQGVQSADGRIVSGMSHDGVHLSTWGGYIAAQAEKTIFVALFGASANVRFQGANLIPNALFSATGAHAAGTRATGLGLYSTNATLAGAGIEVGPDGQIYQVMTGTYTAAGNFLTIAIENAPIASAGIVSGDTFGFEYDFFIEPLNGLGLVPVVSGSFGGINIQKTAQGYVFCSNKWTRGGAIQSRYAGKMALGPFRINEASANLALSGFSLQIGSDHTSGSVKIGISNPRMVKM